MFHSMAHLNDTFYMRFDVMFHTMAHLNDTFYMRFDVMFHMDGSYFIFAAETETTEFGFDWLTGFENERRHVVNLPRNVH